MSDIDVTRLIEEKTTEASLQDALDLVSGFGFTSFQDGSVGLALANIIAELWVRMYNTMVVPAVRAQFNETAEGAALSWYSSSHYDNVRFGGLSTIGTVTMTDSTGDGPHTIVAQEQVFLDSETRVSFRNITGGTIPQGGSLTVQVQCEQEGVLGNVPNARITESETSIAGVTVSNGVSGGTSWILRAGVDRESDAALRVRNSTKWARLSPNNPIDAYVNMILNAEDASGDRIGITRVQVDASNPLGPGTVKIYVANASATATDLQVADLQAYIDDGRAAPGAVVTVDNANEVVVDLIADVTVRRGFSEAASDDAEEAMRAYIDGLPIGGSRIEPNPSAPGYMIYSELIDAVMDVEGVLDVAFSSPAANQPVSTGSVAVVGSVALNMIEV